MINFIVLVHFLLLMTSTFESELADVLHDVDKFFNIMTGSPEEIKKEMEMYKNLMWRSYNLDEGGHQMVKRSIDAETNFIQDEKGIFLIKDIIPVARVPVKFPSDLQIVSAEGDTLYVVALESDGHLPQTGLANHLTLYKLEQSGKSVTELTKKEISGGYRLAYSWFQNVTYILSSEYEADNEEPFKGSTLYCLMYSKGLPTLEIIQILNISHPRDVKFWQHQNQMYLAVGTGDLSGAGKSKVLIYKWLSHHLDFIQKIEGSDVKSVTPFVIGNFMYLVVANHQDIYGNTNTYSEIFRYNLQSGRFTRFQKLRTHAVNDISHFKFSDSDLQKEAHFLAVANLFEIDETGNVNYKVDSYIYIFEDNHFSPFQMFQLYGLLQWFPIMGPKGEFLLLAICSYTVLGFQYDGWRFTQIQLDSGLPFFGNNIVSVRSFIYNKEVFLTFSDKSFEASGMNIWKVHFEHKNYLKEEYEKIGHWCGNMMTELENDDVDEKLKELHAFISKTSDSNSSGHKLILKEVEIETMEAEIFNMYNAEMIADLNYLNDRVKNHRKKLEELSKKMESSELYVYYDVTGVDSIPFLDLNCPEDICCSFENINVGTLNGKDFLSFINNAVTVNEDIMNTRLEFEDIHLIRDLTVLEMNGHPAETLLDTQTDVLLNSELIIDGTVIIQGNLEVSEEFIDLLKSEDEILMESLRNFTGELEVDSVRVKNLEISGKLNGVDVANLEVNSTYHFQDSYQKLNIHNLYLKGSIIGPGNSSVEDQFSRKSEKKLNDSESEMLEVDEIWVTSGMISDIPISDLIQTTAGKSYEKNGNLIFTQQEPKIKVLEVTRSVNGNSSDDKSQVEELKIIVEGQATLEEISDPNKIYSVKDIFSRGVRLNSTVLDGKFEFEEIKVDEVIVDEINGVPVSSWISANSEEIQVVEGMKTFLGDIKVENSIVVKEVNGINLPKLIEDTLFLDGDQNITAKNMTFGEIIAVRATSDSVSVGGENITLKPERIKIFGSVELDTLHAENVTVSGFVDKFQWNEVVQKSLFSVDDTILRNETTEGLFDSRRIQSTGTLNSLPVTEFSKSEQDEGWTEIVVPHDLNLENILHVDDLQFEGSLDSVEKSRFGVDWLLSEGDQQIEAPLIFTDVELRNGADLKSEIIGNIDLKSLFRDSIKLNESVHIKHLTANNIEAEEISVLGTVNGAKFRDSVLLAKSDTPQIVTGEWFLEEDLTVNGSFIVDGFITGVNVTQFCQRNDSSEEEIVNLIVGGNVRFDEEPRILSDVNGVDLNNFAKEIWLKNKDVVLEGKVKFCYIQQYGNITLKGLLNGMDLNELSTNYMSKTKKKIVTGNINIRNLWIKKSCRIRNMTVAGNVNGMELEKWSKSVLLQDEDQIITARHYFSDFATDNLLLSGTVNGLDLAKDVLRKDVEDAVATAEKTFLSLSVKDLVLPEGKKLQGVLVDEWHRRAVKKEGNFTLKGRLTLINPVFEKSLNVNGKVNGLIFDADHILTTSGNQRVTGGKAFDLKNYPGESLRMKELITKGSISGVDIKSLMQNQAFTDEDLVFTGKKSFEEMVITGQLTVKGLFHGENITKLCHDLARPPQPQDLTEEYRELYDEVKIINDNFKEKQFFLGYYKYVQILSDDVVAVLPFSFGESGAISVITATELRIMEWDHFSQSFAYKDDKVLTLSNNITYVTSGVTKCGSFLYLEISNFSKILDSNSRVQIPINGTSCVTNFQLPSLRKSCYFIGREWNDSIIFCNNSNHDSLELFQTLSTTGTVQVSSFTIKDDIYLVVINKEILNTVEKYVVVYKFDQDKMSFYVSSTLPEINPVAVSTITYNHHHFLALAGGHLPESIDTSVVTIFRLSKENDIFVRYQFLLVDTPVDVKFSVLPTSELVLYVLSSNPTKPFIVFLYRGIRGFVEETSGPSLYVGAGVDSFTDSANRHFVFISGFGRGQILRAGFKGYTLPP